MIEQPEKNALARKVVIPSAAEVVKVLFKLFKGVVNKFFFFK